MHKKDLIVGLKSLTSNISRSISGLRDYQWWLGQYAFAKYLIHYLENLNIPFDEKYDFWRIEDYLPELLVDAFEKLRTETDEATTKFREDYVAETGHEVPNITDIGTSNLLDQSSAIQTTLCFMLRDITGEKWVENKIDSYCRAQQHVLQQTFDKFLRRVYRTGLSKMIADTGSGMSGKFGETELRTFCTAGRIMFTFSRLIDKNKKSDYEKDGKQICNEHSVSFVAEEGDPLCLSAGVQSVYCDFRTSLDLIEDVIGGWSKDRKEQKKLIKANEKVSIF